MPASSSNITGLKNGNQWTQDPSGNWQQTPIGGPAPGNTTGGAGAPSNSIDPSIDPYGLLPSSGNIPGAATPQQSPEQKSLYDNQLAQYSAFDPSQFAKDQTNAYSANAQRQLAGTMGGIKEGYNARGLLNSGGAAGDIAGAQATTASNVNQYGQAMAGYGAQLQGQMGGNAFNTAGALAGAGPNIAGTYLSGLASSVGAETQNMGLLNQAYGDLAGGAGAVGGYGLAQLMKKGQDPWYGVTSNNPSGTGYGGGGSYTNGGAVMPS